MLSTDKITDADIEALRSVFADLSADPGFTWNADIRQGGFSLHVRVDGKPGVPAMQQMCNNFLKSPDILHHLILKLLHDELAT